MPRVQPAVARLKNNQTVRESFEKKQMFQIQDGMLHVVTQEPHSEEGTIHLKFLPFIKRKQVRTGMVAVIIKSYLLEDVASIDWGYMSLTEIRERTEAEAKQKSFLAGEKVEASSAQPTDNVENAAGTK